MKDNRYYTEKRADITDLYYIIHETHDHIVIVEDIISAVKVNKATGFSTIAILRNTIPKSVITLLFDYKKTWIWLDYNMKIKSLQYKHELKSLGRDVESIITVKDPKQVTLTKIRELLDE